MIYRISTWQRILVVVCLAALNAVSHPVFGQVVSSADPNRYIGLAQEMEKELSKVKSAPAVEDLQKTGKAPTQDKSAPEVMKLASAEVSGVDITDVKMLGLTQRLLGALITDAATVYTSSSTAIAQIKFIEPTNIWSKAELRDKYDGLRTTMDTIGPLLLALGTVLATKSGSDRSGASISAGTGGLLMLTVPLLKMTHKDWSSSGDDARLAAENASVILQQIEISRRANDDLEVQRRLCTTYLEKGEGRLKELGNLNTACGNLLQRINSKKTVSKEELYEFIDKVLTQVSGYELLGVFFGEFVGGMSTRLEYYSTKYSSLEKGLKKAKEDVSTLKTNYEDNIEKPFLLEVVPLKTQLMKWRAH